MLLARLFTPATNVSPLTFSELINRLHLVPIEGIEWVAEAITVDLRNFNRDLALATAALALVEGAISATFGNLSLAMSIALASAISFLWLRETASGVRMIISRAQESGLKSPGRARLLLFPAIAALALTFILWYMPARPEGVVLGVLNGLLALVYAGIRHQKNLS